jgi:hypothetical protein
MVHFELVKDGPEHLTIATAFPTADTPELRRFSADYEKLAEWNTFVTLDQDGDDTRLSLDLFEPNPNEEADRLLHRVHTTRHLLRATTLLATVTGAEHGVDVYIGESRYEDGVRLPVSVELDWPDGIDDATLSRLGTEYMHAAALGLRMFDGDDEQERLEGVFAHVDRTSGLTLQTNPIGSCAVDTVPMDYMLGEGHVRAVDHNIYSAEQQIVCVSGALAIAYAEELLDI